MSTIGTFSKSENGFDGTLNTLAVKTPVSITRVETKRGEKSPDYRIYAGQTEIGVAWDAKSQSNGNPYLAVRIDDPSFPNAIRARLVMSEDRYLLIWSR